MELDSIECVSSMDGLMDEDEISHHHHPPLLHHHQFASSKPHNNAINNNNAANTNGINGIVGPTAIAPATSVHELLECPVCTNSMYPPIHQVVFSEKKKKLSLVISWFGWIFEMGILMALMT